MQDERRGKPMTEAKSAPFLCPQCGNSADNPREDSIERMLVCADPFHSQSVQTQLPPRPETYMDRTTERIKPGEDAPAVTYITALEAENESLKDRLAGAQKALTEQSCQFIIQGGPVVRATALDMMRDRAEKAEADLAAMTEDRNLWQQAHDEDCPNKAMVETLTAERDKALEVIREYRKGAFGHRGCTVSHRCPTCIKADVLLLQETKES